MCCVHLLWNFFIAMLFCSIFMLNGISVAKSIKSCAANDVVRSSHNYFIIRYNNTIFYFSSIRYSTRK